MCVALPVIAVAASVASTAIGAYGAYQSGQAQSQAASYQAAVARNNAVIAQQNANSARDAGEVQAQNTLLASGARGAGIRAAAAAAGLDPNSGTPQSLQSDQAKLGQLDSLTVRQRAEDTARGFEVQGSNATAQAQLDEMTASQAQTAGLIGAAGGLLSGASSVSAKWSDFRTTGLFKP